ncbi:MAG TPA: sigma-70 family RNA polymerase sigma factor [Thermoanaerobaculia bacterium]
MTDQQQLAESFELHRDRLRAVAYRMLGSVSEAEDAVQEAWLRLSRTDGVENLGGWLTTVVSRVCLDTLRSRKSRGEESLEDEHCESTRVAPRAVEEDAMLAESVGLALLVVLDTLSPAERVSFVLHDMFDLSFEDVGQIIDRSPEASRQLASRARRRVQGADAPPAPDRSRHRQLVTAFLAAARAADLQGLLAVLDPDAVVLADSAAIRIGAMNNVRGAEAVAKNFSGRATGSLLAIIDGEPGLVWAPGGQTRVAFAFTFANDQIAGVELIADPDTLRELDLTIIS